MVKKFHVDKNIDIVQKLQGIEQLDLIAYRLRTTLAAMHSAARACEEYAKDHLDQANSAYYLRISLLLEELAETIDGILLGDEIETLDGLADLAFVVFGTACSLDLPLSEAFEEVWRSNMSKAPKTSSPRLRDKGDEYFPPNLAAVLHAHYKRNSPS